MKNVFGNITKILENKELTYFDKSVYFALISFNGKNKCFPSLKAIGDRINSKSITYISNSIKKLKEMEIVTVIRRKHKSNVYILNPLFEDLKPGTEKPKPPPKRKKDKTDTGKTREEISEYLNKYNLSEETKKKAIENITSGKITIPEYAKLMSFNFENSLWRDLTVKYLAECRGAESPENPDFSIIGGFIKNNRKDLPERPQKYIILMQCIGKYENEIKTQGFNKDLQGYIGKAFKEYYTSDYIKLFFLKRPEKRYKPKPQGEENYYL